MAGNYTRNRGRRGQQEFANLLRSLDWSVAELNAGTCAEDFIAVSPNGSAFAVEVKNCAVITQAHRQQAMRQAQARKMPWICSPRTRG